MFEFLKEVDSATLLPEAMVRKAFDAMQFSQGLFGQSAWETDVPELEFAAESAFLAATLEDESNGGNSIAQKEAYLLIGARISQRLYEIAEAKKGSVSQTQTFRHYVNAGIGYYAARRNAIAAAIARKILDKIVANNAPNNVIVSLYSIAARVMANELKEAVSLCGTVRSEIVEEIYRVAVDGEEQYSILVPFIGGAVGAVSDYLSAILEGALDKARTSFQTLSEKAKFIDRLGYTEVANLLHRLSFSFEYLVEYSSWRILELLPSENDEQKRIVKTFVDNEINIGKYFLFHSQYQALFEHKILAMEGHQILSMPTGAGKTLLASLLMLKHLLQEDRGKVIFIVPTRALAREKLEEFESILSKHGLTFAICQITGEIVLDSKETLETHDILIMTQEKFDMLLRERFFDIPLKAVLADEFHNIFRSYRGLKLQISLDRLRQSKRYGHVNVYLISAILSDATQSNIGNWLYPEGNGSGRASFRTDWRPTFTKRGIFDLAATAGQKKGKHPYWVVEFGDGSRSELPAPSEKIGSNAKNKAGYHLAKHFAKDDQVYFFVGSTYYIDNKAIDLGDFLNGQSYSYIGTEQQKELEIVIRKVRRIIGDCDLVKALQEGVATHYGALPVSIRRLMEKAVRKRLVPVIIATNTLADGLNLPVKTIIIPNPKLGQEALDGGLFLNLVGRAGRPFRSEEGQLIMLTSTGKAEVEKEGLAKYMSFGQKDLDTEYGPLAHWILSSTDRIVDRLEENSMFVAVLESLLLAVIEEELHAQLSENHSLARSLLFQSNDPSLIEKVLVVLGHIQNKFVNVYRIVEWKDGHLEVNDLGRAVNASGFSPSSALSLLLWMSNHPKLLEAIDSSKLLVFSKPFSGFWEKYVAKLETTIEGKEFLSKSNANDKARALLGWIRGDSMIDIAKFNFGNDRLRAMSELEGSLSGVAAWGFYALHKLVNHCSWKLPKTTIANLGKLRECCYYGDHSPFSEVLFAKDVSRILLRDDVVSLRKAIESGDLRDFNADPELLRREDFHASITLIPGLLLEPDELVANLKRVYRVKD